MNRSTSLQYFPSLQCQEAPLVKEKRTDLRSTTKNVGSHEDEVSASFDYPPVQLVFNDNTVKVIRN